MVKNKYFDLITTGLLSLSLIYCGDDSKVISISPYNTWRWTKCSMHWVETCRYLTWTISNSNHKARRVIRPTNQELVKSGDATEPRPLFEMVWADRNAVMKTDWQNKLTWVHHQNIWRTKMSSKPTWIPIWIRNDVPLQVIKREMQISEAPFSVLYPDKRGLYFFFHWLIFFI